MNTRPQSVDDLLTRANFIKGYSLGELANGIGVPIPFNLKKHKGWIGNFIEHLLGADAGSKAEQDFAHLDIELKTIPVNASLKPLETTFVSLAPLTGNIGLCWERSHVKKKLSKVLWIPILSEKTLPLKDRLVGSPILWSPSKQEEHILKQDWEELTELITLGKFNIINAQIGEALQLRPKGANRKTTTSAYDRNGKSITTLPLGFYLRTHFTAQILQTHSSLKPYDL